MWLLNARTYELKYIEDETRIYGRYAILSHTWEDDEVTFQDIKSDTARQKKGFEKVKQTCRLALEDKLDYCWVDTACIDKTSSAELSEAINSMFRWYSEAKVCYAYLSDLPAVALKDARWFTRSWTLQELIASAVVAFYDSSWTMIRTKLGSEVEMSEITGIHQEVLRDRSTLPQYSVAQRMYWSSKRQATRLEDRAYSLFGIFDVNMPLLYGEGSKAFPRLQEEIMRSSTDHSILAWNMTDKSHMGLLLAPAPECYQHCRNLVSWSALDIDESFQLTNQGLRISLPVLDPTNSVTWERKNGLGSIHAVLNCRESSDTEHQLALCLRKQPRQMMVPARDVLTSTVCRARYWFETSNPRVPRTGLPNAGWSDLVILRQQPVATDSIGNDLWKWEIRIDNRTGKTGVRLESAHPEEALEASLDKHEFPGHKMNMFLTGSIEHDRGYLVFSDGTEQRKYGLFFGQAAGVGAHRGSEEPYLSLKRFEEGKLVPSNMQRLLSASVATTAQQHARVEFRKGLELCATIKQEATSLRRSISTIDLSIEIAADASLNRTKTRHPESIYKALKAVRSTVIPKT